MSNYPPGVSGREPQITGEWPCENCGCILPEEWEGEPYSGTTCPDGCPEPDWDRIAEERAERMLEDHYDY